MSRFPGSAGILPALRSSRDWTSAGGAPALPALLFLAAFTLWLTPSHANNGTAIDVDIRRVPFEVDGSDEGEVGRLRFRGGVSVSSSNAHFGGLSGLIVSADGTTFLAVTDAGYWVKGRLAYQGNRLHSVKDVSLAPILGPDGKHLGSKSDFDAEGLAPLTAHRIDGDVLVSFEGKHRIEQFSFGKDGFDALPTAIYAPKELEAQPSNGGLEAIVRLDDLRVLAISEEMRDTRQNITAWLIPLNKDKVQDLSIRADASYAISDIAELPSGDFLTLERRFSPWGGVGAQMRIIKRSDVIGGATLDGEVIAEMGMSYAIDNLEGVSTRRGENGETLIYVVSDDNFRHPLQQTLFLLYELAE